ncbi:hypothetical protein [Ruficoccus sp. ZRK36]|uniref:hypothetical protein n=1 Tax=Ruficoccus sp. ZRK36 TaxID=2866311 RepID=UPI001C7337C2|nr:hypothetical protein [Ruficoccus sp. ZRK36]QYY35311.1 hypothetical protein K0V07_13545 [Ruficoccus sp. ZRK36]
MTPIVQTETTQERRQRRMNELATQTSQGDRVALGLERVVICGVDITDEILEIAREEQAQRLRRAVEDQRLLAQLGGTVVRHTRKFKIGSVRPMPGVYQYWVDRENRENNHWGKEEINPWDHEEFRRDLARDNPEIRTVYAKPTDRVSMSGVADGLFTGAGWSNKRSTQTYG